MDIDILEEVSFLKLGQGDAKEIQDIEEQCFTLPWTAEQYSLAFGQKSFLVFGARLRGRLIAYASLYHTADQMEILNFAVLPALRKKGIGRKLLRALLQCGAKIGIVNFVLEVRENNAPAIALYEGLGFVLSGKRRGYYVDTGEDALIYNYEPQSILLQQDTA